eukprot:snap_masked-scaffold_69-processed-gene-0.14-mRNA-1 protein AED:1.00 eAED:1.00 QI:0/0/0/0/1/1/2/0/657
METQLSAPTKEEVDLQKRNQSETNDSWISYRGSTPEEMLEVVKNVSANRFRVKKQSSHSFSEDETKRIFGFSKKFMRRCKLKCTSSRNCTLELNFKFDLKLGKYIFQVKCLGHTGHEVQVNKNERKFLSDLKPAELRMLKYLGVADTPLTSVEVALHPKFPGIYFDKDNGGNFELYYSNDTEGRPRLKGLTFQEQLQVKLKNIYSESIQIDTTHGLSRYIFVAMFPVGVDCFMKAVNFGCTLMQTENHEQVIRGLKDLGLEHTEVMMSDGSLALAKAAKLLGAEHVRCVKHFAASFSSGAKGLRGSYVSNFLDRVNQAVREDFHTNEKLDAHLQKLSFDFLEPEQQQFLKNIKVQKENICWTYVKRKVTFGHVSTQRVEGFHAKFKGSGQLSSKQKSWTIDQLISFHEKQVVDYTNSTLKKLKKLISKGEDISEEVDKMLTSEIKKVTGCYVVADNGDRTYIVSETENDISRLYNVEVRDINGWIHPECSCSTWTNLKLPCCHYARICVSLKRKCIDKVNLLPRWRFQEHPLHEVALKELGQATTPEERVLNFNVKVPGFKELKVLKKPGVRFSMLKTACRDLCEEAQHSTDEGWRKAYATVIKMTDALKQNADGDFSDVDMSLSQHSGSTILSPRKRKMRRKGTVVASQSRLNFNT